MSELGELILAAAKAIVTAERNFGCYCRNCGMRLGLSHHRDCRFREQGSVVEGFDTYDIETLVEKKVTELREGKL